MAQDSRLTNIDLRALLFLLLFSIPLFFLNIHNTHSGGGDDYAQYIKEAQNIAQGKPFYQSNYVFNKYNNCYSPPQYPPGFPLLLAPVVRYFGIAIQPMCYFNTVMAICIMLALYVYFRKYAGAVAAVCLAVIITYSGCMIDLKQSVLSDAASMLFVLLYLIYRNAKTFSRWRILLLILFASMAILIRTQSILLIFAEVIFLLISAGREWY
jgi:4-amino-4-deoxy-L-arabinose transferase-like glycosyltransferase